MEATELRIGNFLFNDGVVNTVGVVSAEYIELKTPQRNYIRARSELVNPIPLTEEWLLKFGFESHVRGGFKIYIQIGELGPIALQIAKPPRYDGYLLEWAINEFDRTTLTDVEHVHQLQNLYKALTGEELTLKSVVTKTK